MLAARASMILWCPVRLLGHRVKEQINWPLFEARVGLGGFLPLLPRPFSWRPPPCGTGGGLGSREKPHSCGCQAAPVLSHRA